MRTIFLSTVYNLCNIDLADLGSSAKQEAFTSAPVHLRVFQYSENIQRLNPLVLINFRCNVIKISIFRI